jgi:hypothetical protein
VVSLDLQGEADGEARAVQVIFRQLAGELGRTAVYAYWVSPSWKSPSPTSITNHLGQRPYLLKIQILLDDTEPEGEQTLAILSQYLGYLAKQLKQTGIV